MDVANIFAEIPNQLVAEHFTTLRTAQRLRIERIVTPAHAPGPGPWYDQDQHEWILLLRGSAALEFQGDGEPTELLPGAYLNIPAHRAHRVAWTDAHEETVWLAIHYDP